MALRTTKSSITFDAPFKLRDVDEILLAGSYDVETEEEIIEGNERTVYRRVATLLYLRSSGMTRVMTVDPENLETARARDLEPVPIETGGHEHKGSEGIDTANTSHDESYHLNRQPHERMLAAETADPLTRAAHLKLARMHGQMARQARVRSDRDDIKV